MKPHLEQVIDVVVDELNVPSDRVSVHVRLADLGADSLDCLGIAIRLEEIFGISICDIEVENLRTVGDIVDLVGRATSKTSAQRAVATQPSHRPSAM